jgi:asparagine synthase (glutamine-hydrolysing)
MSGIVGMVNLDGSPIDRELLERMTGFLAFRGPDALATWEDGPVGFGHTLLRTTFESEQERQPCSLDGAVWITADARIDDRANLIDKLKGHGRQATLDVPDVELILHAYHVWGEKCVEHLLGDFAFAIWDGRERRLFCARDHFGVKPFYYARVGDCLVFGNTLNCLRSHPAVSDELNDLAIADFLLVGYNEEPATTTFADIQRLPAAHCLTCVGDQSRLRRYWALPIDGHIRYRRPDEYVERFKELLRGAVSDRLRTPRVAVMMSGGLDSTAVAAVAKELLAERGQPFDLRAFTVVYDRLIPDQERHYSGVAAEALGIPIHYLALDDYGLFDRWDEPELQSPEPVHSPLAASSVDYLQQVAAHGRVALTGYGGDPVLYPSPHYFRDLLKCWRFGQAVVEFSMYLVSHRRLPPLGTGIHARLRRWLGEAASQPAFPPWLNKDLATRHDLPARWGRLLDGGHRGPVHPLRPQAYADLASPYWQTVFEVYDPVVHFCSVEVRNPFFDVRLVTYLLAIPPLPWFANKEMLRAAMRGRLPEGIRLRLKAPLAGSPELEHCRAGAGKWVDNFDPHPGLTGYVDRDAIPPVTGDDDPLRVWANMRPLSLNYWLRHAIRANKGGMSNGIRPAIHQARS